MLFAMVYLQGCRWEVLEWAIFADQHLERLEKQAVQCIADNFKDLEALPEFNHLSPFLLRRIFKVLAGDRYR